MKLIIIAFFSLGITGFLEFIWFSGFGRSLCDVFRLDPSGCLGPFFLIAIIFLLFGVASGFTMGHKLLKSNNSEPKVGLKTFLLSLFTGLITLVIDGLIIAGILGPGEKALGLRGIPGNLEGPGFIFLLGVSFLFWFWFTRKLDQKLFS